MLCHKTETALPIKNGLNPYNAEATLSKAQGGKDF